MKLRWGGWGAAAVSMLQGCSFISVNGPPPGHDQIRYFDCTTEDYASGLDVYLAGGYAVSAGGSLLAALEADEVHAAHGVAMAGTVVLAGVHALSAAYGYDTTEACREARSMAGARAHDSLTSAITGGRQDAAALDAPPPSETPAPAPIAP